MKNSEIIIGQKYTHPNHVGCVYLGIGIKSHGGKKIKHALVIVSEGHNQNHTVIRIATNHAWWKQFQKKA